MTLIIVIPLLLGVCISLIDLDQYTLRRWLGRPVHRPAELHRGVPAPACRTRSGSASRSRCISTVVTVPIGVAAAIATQNRYRGRALVRAIFLIPYVLPSFVVATVWRTMLQPDGIVNILLDKVGIDGAALAERADVLLDADPGGDLGGLAVHLPDGAGRPAVASTARCTRRRRSTGRTGGRSCATSCCRTCAARSLLAFLLATLNHINNFTLPFVLFGAPAPDVRQRDADARLRHQLPEPAVRALSPRWRSSR